MTKSKFGKPLCRSIMAVVMMMLSLQAMAYNFTYTYQGKTLYYYVTSGSTIKVTYYSSISDFNNYVNGDVVIPSTVTYNGTTYSVTSIGKSAFSGCSSLTSVTIPNSVTSIGISAFSDCSGLTSITIPNSVTSIGQSAFSDCSSLTSVTIPNSVTSIGKMAFVGCSGLTSITIPNSVTSIGKMAFVGCSGLTSINVASGNTHYSSIDGVLYNYVQNTLIQCPGARTSVTIPNSVTSIGEGAFSGCSGLTSVRCLASAPPSIGSSSFSGISSTCTLTVSCVSLDAYIGSDWNTYFGGRILEDSTEEFPFELTASANDLTAGSVDISIGERCDQRILTATPKSCYRFVAWNDGNTNNPRTIRVTQDTTLTANFERAVYTQAISHVICEGSTYTENGFNVSEAGTYTLNLQTVNGCDSIVTLTLSVNPVESTTLSAAICEGTTYTENGFNVSEVGTYTQNLQTVNGCDSIVTLTLSVNPVESTTLSAAICEGATYTENGFNVSEAGTYTQNLQTVNGCDSIVTLTLTVNPVESTTLSAAICEGTSYTDNGFNVSEAGTYTQNLQTVNGCDSIVTLTLTVNPTYNITIDASINEGEMYEENGFSESEAGTYVHTLQSEFGCDSVITLNLTVNSSLNDVVANAVEVSLYPNPARAYTMLKVEGLKEQTIVYLFDIQGRKLKEYVLNAAQQTLRIDASDLPKGVYTITIGNTTKKLIVE